MKPDFAQRFIRGFTVAGLGALAVLGVIVGYRLLHAAGPAEIRGLIGGWLMASFGVALVGGLVDAARLWALWAAWTWWT